MRTKIIRIGNSQGIRIPKVMLQQTRLGEEVEIEAHEDQIVIRQAVRPRQDWDRAFEEMAKRGDDVLLDDISANRWDEEEWQWK